MSNVIDQKVVEMRFDNQQFERNVSTTMSTLEKLKSRLNLTGATKGMENLGAAAKGVNLNGLSSAAETVRDRFSALEVMGVTALANITNSAVNAGKRILGALTIEPVKTGFQEYELKMGSVQTIMASTGETLETVNKYLGELNKYSDQTIYSFSDMTQNIGKFTNAGVKLEDAVAAIKGISNEAALSGANANEASRAMYNFAQALSAGYVKLIDWKSIENANMATVGFKEELINTAVALGTVTKAGDGMYETLTGETFNATKNFNEVLQEQWMTSEVLVETLKKYADENTEIGKKASQAATEVKTATMLFDTLKEAAQSGWAQTWELIVGDFNQAKGLFTQLSNFLGGIIDASARARNFLLEGALNLAKPWQTMMDKLDKAGLGKIKDLAEDVGGLTKKLEYFQDVVDRVWKGEFFNSDTGRYELLEKAGYDHRVVQDLVNKGHDYKLTIDDVRESHKKFGLTMDETSDATKGLVFNLADLTDEQLKEAGFTKEEIRLFRDLANEAERTGVSIEDLVERMSKKDGRTLLLDSFKNILQGIGAVLKGMKDAWVEIFPPMSVVTLYNIIDALNRFSQHLRVGDETAKDIKDTFKGLFAILDIVLTIVGGPIKWAFKGLCAILEMFDMNIWDLTGSIGRSIVQFRDWVDEHLAFTNIIKKVAPWIEKFADSIEQWFEGLKDVDNIPKYLLEGFINGIKNGVKNVVETIVNLGKTILEAFCDVLGIHSPSTETYDAAKWFIQGFIDGIKAFGKHAWDSIKGFGSGILKVFNFIIDGVKKYAPKVWDTLSGFVKKCVDVLKEMDWGAILTVGVAIGFLVVAARISSALAKLSAPLEGFQDVAHSLKKVMNSLALDIKAQALITVAKAIAILAGSVLVLTFIEPAKLWNAVGVIAVLTGLLAGLTAVMGKFGPKEGIELGKITLAIIGISAALLILSKAMKNLSGIDQNGLVQGGLAIGYLGVIMLGLVAMTKLFNKDALNVGGTLLLMSASILLLVFVMKQLSKLDPEQIMVGGLAVSAFGVLIGGLLLITRLARPGELKGLGTTLLLMSSSILLMIFVVKQAAKLDSSTVVKGSLAVGAFVLLLGGLLAVTRLSGGQVKGLGTTLLLMSGALLVMTKVIKTLGSLDAKTLKQGGAAVIALSGLIIGLIAATKLAGETKGMASTLLAVSVSIGILTGIAVLLGFVKTEHLAKGIVAVGLLASIVGGLIIATRKAQNVKGAIFAMALTIGVMVGAIAALSLIDPKSMVTSTAALVLLMGTFALMGKTLSGTKLDLGAIFAMTLVVGALGGILSAMALLDAEASVQNATAIGLLLVALGVSMKVIDRTHVSTADVGKAALMGLVVAELALILGVMDDLRVEGSIATATSLAILLLAMSVAMGILGLTPTSTKDVATVALMGIVVAELALILGVMAKMDVEPSIETAKALSLMLLAMSGALIILGAVGFMGPAAFIGIGALATLIAGIGGIIIGFGALVTEVESAKAWFDNGVPMLEKIIEALNSISIKTMALMGVLTLVGLGGPAAFIGIAAFDALIVGVGGLIMGIGALVEYFPMLEDFLDAGIPILDKIGHAIGSFIGNIAGGILEGVSDSFPAIGENLSKFMENAKGFIDGCSDVTLDTVAGAGFLAAAVAALTAADLYNGISSFIQNGSSIADLGSQLSDFMANAQTFIKGVNGIDSTAADGAAALAGMILALTAADLINGVASFLGMDTDFSKFGRQLESFGASLVNFSSIVSGNINEAAVKAASQCGELMSTLANGIPRSGSEFMKWFIGEKNLNEFGKQLEAFGKSMVKFSNAVSNEGQGIDESAITAAAKCGELMSTLANGIPRNSSSFMKWFIGEKDLDEFGNQLEAFGKSMVQFSNAVGSEGTEINEDAVKAAANAGKIMSALADGIPRNGSSFMNWLVGEKDLGTFGEQLEVFGYAMSDFAKAIGDGIDEGAVESAANAGKILAALQENLPDLEDGWFSETTTLDEFGNSIDTFGEDIADFYDAISGIDNGSMYNVVSTIEDLVDVMDDMADIDVDGIDEFSSALTKLNEAPLSDFNTAFGAANYTPVMHMTQVANGIKGLEGLDDSGAVALKGAITQLSDANMTDFIAGFSTSAADAVTNMNVVRAGIATLTGLSSTGAAAFKDAISYLAASNIVTAITNFANASIPQSMSYMNIVKNGVLGLAGKDFSGAKAFATAIKQLNDSGIATFATTFGSFIGGAITNMVSLKNGINKLVDLDSSKVLDFVTAINTLGTASVDSFISAFTTAMPELRVTGETMVSAVASGIGSKKSDIPSALTSSVTSAVATLGGYYNSFYSAGAHLANGFANGISANAYKAAAQASAMASAAAAAARAALQIHSPSRVMERIGDFAGQGFVNALMSAARKSYSAGVEIADSARAGLNRAISKATALLNGEMDFNPTIRPVLDLSEIRSGAGLINGMFTNGPSVSVRSSLDAISASMVHRGQNGSNGDVVSAINKLRTDLSELGGNHYSINGLTVEEGSGVADAIELITRTALRERRS